jgi:RHS repeat-associated protein
MAFASAVYAAPTDPFSQSLPDAKSSAPKGSTYDVGDHGVSEQRGAATYAFPIDVPPGRNGVAPSLSLQYSSAGAIRGGVAVGWTMDLPSISIDATAGRSTTVRYRSSLSGDARLISTKFLGDVAVANSLGGSFETFRATNDAAFVRYQKNESLEGAGEWVARTSAGTIYTFGAFDGRKWLLTEQRDWLGNTATYSWQLAQNGGVAGWELGSILYTTNPGAGITQGHAAVEFIYFGIETCPGSTMPIGAEADARAAKTAPGEAPTVPAPIVSMYVTSPRRLQLIRTKVRDTQSSSTWRTVREVELGYDPTELSCGRAAAPQRMLTSITTRGWAPAATTPTVAPVVRFKYGETQRAFDSVITMGSSAPLEQGTSSGESAGLTWQLMDVDGDGLQDRVTVRADPVRVEMVRTKCQFVWYAGEPGGQFAAVPNIVDLPTAKWAGDREVMGQGESCNLSGQIARSKATVGGNGTCQRGKGTQVGYHFLDWDGDHRLDLVTSLWTDGLFSKVSGMGNPWIPADDNGGCPSGLNHTGTDKNGTVHCACPAGTHLGGTTGATAWCEVDGNPLPGDSPDPLPPWEPGGGGGGGGAGMGCTIHETEPEVAKLSGAQRFPIRVYTDLAAKAAPLAQPDRFAYLYSPMPPTTADPRLDWSVATHSSLPTLFDVDGDGLVDYLPETKVDADPQFVRLGSGYDIDPVALPWPDPVFAPATAGGWAGNFKTTPNSRTLSDLNGDGLPDMVVEDKISASEARLRVGWNTGKKFSWLFELGGPSGLASQPVELTKTRVDTWQIENVRAGKTIRWASRKLMDVDFDGRPDLVVYADPAGGDGTLPGSPQVHINLGDRFASQSVLLGPEWAWSADVRRATLATESQGRNRWYRETSMADWDGDGYIDMLRWQPTTATGNTETGLQSGLWGGNLSVRRGAALAGPARLLQEVQNGRGEVVKFDYAPSTDPSLREADSASWRIGQTWLVKKVTVRPGFNQPPIAMEYRYGSPQYGRRSADDVDPEPPQFLGFGTVRSIAPTPTGALGGVQTVNKYTYAVGGDGRGFVVESQVWNGTRGANQLFLESIETSNWEPKTLFSGKVGFVASGATERRLCPTPAAGAALPGLAEQRTACLGSVNWLRTTPLWTAWRATSQGPDLLYVNTGASSQDSATFGTITTTSTFDVWYGPDYKVFPKLKTTYHFYSDLDVRTIAKSETVYDAKGLPTRSREWIDAATFRETVRTFDAATGNVLTEQKPNQVGTGAVTTLTYESHKIYPYSTANELGHSVFTTVDVGTGRATLSQGPNFKIVASAPVCNGGWCFPVVTWKYDEDRVVYDGLGRPIENWSTYNFGGASDAQVLLKKTTYVEPIPPSASSTEPTTMHQVVEETLRDPAEATPFWMRTTTSVDGSGRVVSVATYRGPGQLDAVTSYAYDAASSLVSQAQPSADLMSPTVTYTYKRDALGRVTEFRRPDGTGVDMSYATVSLGLYQPATEVRSVEYSSAALGGTSVYRSDVRGNLVEVEQADLGALTLYAYDEANRLIEVTDAADVPNITSLEHDWVGQRTKIIRDSRSWGYAYDKNGNVIAEIAPHLGADHAAYTSTNTYDALDRLTAHNPATRGMSTPTMQALGIGPTWLFYDDASVPNGKGYLTRVEQRPAWDIPPDVTAPPTPPAPIFKAEMQYEANGRVKWEQHTFAPPGLAQTVQSVSREYNTSGKPTRSTWDDGQTVFSSYDARGLVQKVEWAPTVNGVRTLIADYGVRLAAGAPGQRATGLGQRRAWKYDKLGRPILDEIFAKPTGASAEVAYLSRAYTFDGLGDVKTITGFTRTSSASTSPVNISGTFGYDKAHRLVSASQSITGQATYTANLTYSKTGNISTANIQGVGGISNRNVQYSYGARDPQAVDAITSLSGGLGGTFQYDLSGNMSQRTWGVATNFVWDGDDQLRQVTSNQGIETYHYDQGGARVWARKLSGGAMGTRYWFGESETFVPTSGSPVRYLYIADGGGLLARTEKVGAGAPSVELHYTDSLQSLALTLKTTGTGTSASTAVTGYFIYGAFGEVLKQNAIDPGGYGDTAHRRQFNGKENDTVSQWRYYGARYYDPLIMRWTGADPLYRSAPDIGAMDPERQNLYSFSLNNPGRFYDPDGRDPKKTGDDDSKKKKKKASKEASGILLLGMAPLEGQEIQKRNADGTRDTSEEPKTFHLATTNTKMYKQGVMAALVPEMPGGATSSSVADGAAVNKALSGKTADTVVYYGHAIIDQPTLIGTAGGKTGRITPTDFANGVKAMKSMPKKIYLYGCNTVDTGFAKALSTELPGVVVVGIRGLQETGVETSWPSLDVTNVKIDRTSQVSYQDGKLLGSSSPPPIKLEPRSPTQY